MEIALIVLAVVVIGVIAVAAWFVMHQRQKQAQQRSMELREGFGPEYDRTVRETGSQRKAERELLARKERVQALHIRPLPREECARYAESWRLAQARFVDDPGGAISEADDLIGEVMRARGYPVGDFEQRAADVSVDHPNVVTHYHAAHQIALAHERGDAGTEELRQAMVHYRALFNDLLESDDEGKGTTREENVGTGDDTAARPRTRRLEVRR